MDCHGGYSPILPLWVRFLFSWLLHHDGNRDRYSANQNLLPYMHLHVPVSHVTISHETRPNQDAKEVFSKL